MCLSEWGNMIYFWNIEEKKKKIFEDHFVIGVEEMKIPSAGKQITLLRWFTEQEFEIGVCPATCQTGCNLYDIVSTWAVFSISKC